MYAKLISVFDALPLLAEPRRVEILRLVWATERSAGEIARNFRLTFGAVSQHLGRLTRAGLLVRRRIGRSVMYRANHEALGPFAAALEAMWADKLNTLKDLAEAQQRRSDAVTRRARRGRMEKP